MAEEAEDDESQAEEDDQDEYSRGAPRLPWGITRKVLREAPVSIWSEGRPKPGDRVTVHFVARLQDGTQVQDSRAGEKPAPLSFTVQLLPREVIVGMDLAVLTMRRTEVAEFKIAPRFAYDDLGSPPRVPPNATMLFEVELLSFETQQDLFGDGMAIKTVRRAGDEHIKPVRGQEVVMNYRLTGRRGDVLEEHEHWSHTVGDEAFGTLSRSVSAAVLSMCEGERCVVAFHQYFAPDGPHKERRYAKGTLELELEQVFDTCDVSPLLDRSLIKKVLVRGRGDRAVREASRVALRVEAASDGLEPLYGFSGPRTLELTVGNGDVCDALSFAVAEMKVGERALLTCSPPMPQCLELELGLVNIRAPRAELTVELLRCVDEAPDALSLPPADFLAHLRSRKEVAGDLYGRDRLCLASKVYGAAASLAAERPSEELDTGVVEDVGKLQTVCKLNRAACELKLGQFSAARELCDSVLLRDPGSIKALYRRASASFGLSDYAAALRDCARLLEREPSNAEGRRLAAQIKEAQRHYAHSARQTAARMLGEPEPVDSPAASDAAEAERPVGLLWRLAALSACLPVGPCVRLFRRQLPPSGADRR